MKNNREKFRGETIRTLLPGKADIEGNQVILPEKLLRYHYTSPEALLSIVQNQTLRFSDIRYMNDKTEGIYFVKVLLDFMDKNRDKYPRVQEAINLLLDENDFTRIQRLDVNEIVFREIEGIPYRETRDFLFCASIENDALNMWNYYLRNGQYQGYNLGIHMDTFLRSFTEEPSGAPTIDGFVIYYGDVLYGPAKQEAELAAFLEQIERLGNKRNDKYIAIQLRNYMRGKGLFYKHSKFKDEHEFRIVISIAEERIPLSSNESNAWIGTVSKNIFEEFYIRNGIIVPCLNVPLRQNAVSRITIAPIMEFGIAKASIKEILKLNNFDSVSVHQSQIPIRF